MKMPISQHRLALQPNAPTDGSTTVGHIHSYETFGTVDGPGIRLIIFMQGCQWRCKYCHNRDTWDIHGGDILSVDELMNTILDYRYYFQVSDGGITVSGGEPTLQAGFVKELFNACQHEDIHTCLDTNGFIENYSTDINEMVAATDLTILDIKQMDNRRHLALTKISNKPTLHFAKHLASLNKPVWIRYVVVDGYTSDLESAHALGRFLQPMKNIQRVELLPYHELGKYKWAAIGEPYELDNIKPPSPTTLKAIHDVIAEYGLEVRY